MNDHLQSGPDGDGHDAVVHHVQERHVAELLPSHEAELREQKIQNENSKQVKDQQIQLSISHQDPTLI